MNQQNKRQASSRTAAGRQVPNPGATYPGREYMVWQAQAEKTETHLQNETQKTVTKFRRNENGNGRQKQK